MLEDARRRGAAHRSGALRDAACRRAAPGCVDDSTEALRAGAPADPAGRRRAGEPRLRDLHLGLDRPAQGGRGRAPRRSSTSSARMARSAGPRRPATSCSRSPRSRSTSRCSRSVAAARRRARGCVLAGRDVAADGAASAALLRDVGRDRSCRRPPPPGGCCSRPGWHGRRRGSQRALRRRGAAAPTSRASCSRAAAAAASLWNLYGPTETTSGRRCSRCARPRRGAAAVPIGRPIANTAIHLLDRARSSRCRSGVPGELCIGGAGLARGYLRRARADRRALRARPVRAARRARASTAPATSRAAWPTATLEFLGRADHQVKVRGFRIELGRDRGGARARTRRCARRWCWRARTAPATAGWSPTSSAGAAAAADGRGAARARSRAQPARVHGAGGLRRPRPRCR